MFSNSSTVLRTACRAASTFLRLALDFCSDLGLEVSREDLLVSVLEDFLLFRNAQSRSYMNEVTSSTPPVTVLAFRFFEFIFLSPLTRWLWIALFTEDDMIPER